MDIVPHLIDYNDRNFPLAMKEINALNEQAGHFEHPSPQGYVTRMMEGLHIFTLWEVERVHPLRPKPEHIQKPVYLWLRPVAAVYCCADFHDPQTVVMSNLLTDADHSMHDLTTLLLREIFAKETPIADVLKPYQKLVFRLPEERIKKRVRASIKTIGLKFRPDAKDHSRLIIRR